MRRHSPPCAAIRPRILFFCGVACYFQHRLEECAAHCSRALVIAEQQGHATISLAVRSASLRGEGDRVGPATGKQGAHGGHAAAMMEDTGGGAGTSSLLGGRRPRESSAPAGQEPVPDGCSEEEMRALGRVCFLLPDMCATGRAERLCASVAHCRIACY